MIYLILLWEFFKTGLFAVGGGLATLPFLRDMADRYDWLTHEQLTNMIAVGESTPGPIGVNCATYAGYNAAGIPGALVATFALVLPSFIIILIVAKFLEKYRKSALMNDVFAGLRPAACGLIAAAGWSVMETSILDMSAIATSFFAIFKPAQLIIFAVILALANIKYTKKLHPLAFIGGAAAVGIIFSL